MKDFESIEELIIDDSFVNYCFKRNPKDIQYWENRIKNNPQEQYRIHEARKTVLGLHAALKQKHERETGREVLEQKNNASKILSIKKAYKVWGAVAAVLVIFLGGRFLLKAVADTEQKVATTEELTVHQKINYKTGKGERKFVTLSDSTKIWLNADSELRIDTAYGIHNRSIHLVGEALFDVRHNESLPFIVFTENYQVVDLGTIFNVKAYPGEQTGEASLIKGIIEISLDGVKDKITLKPNQKVIIDRSDRDKISIHDEQNGIVQKKTAKTMAVIAPLSFSSIDNSILETSWIDRLEFDNENFYQMKSRLERWFGLDVVIEDSIAGEYRFTATFKNESIEEALQALQYAYPFNFKILNNEVIISK